MTFVMQTDYEYTYNWEWSVRSLLVSKYKVLKLWEVLRLYMTDNFNIDETSVDL